MPPDARSMMTGRLRPRKSRNVIASEPTSRGRTSSTLDTLAAADYGSGPTGQTNVGQTLVMYDPSTPSQAMRYEDIPLESQFESFEQLASSDPPVKILFWPAIIVVGHAWGLIWVLTSR